MLFFHCADIHLDSRMESHLNKQKAHRRRVELMETFTRLASAADAQGVAAVLLSGDVFDTETPNLREQNWFLQVVRDHPGTDFLYLRGNHDQHAAFSDDLPENLKTFSASCWTVYSYGNVRIYGMEKTDANVDSLYPSLMPAADTVNIVMLHGQVSTGRDHSAINICLPDLTGKQIDYLALGHIHAYSRWKLDERGIAGYCGCPEGRGYDECGEKGYVRLEVDGLTVTDTFVPFGCRMCREVPVPCDTCQSTFDIVKRVGECLAKSADERDLVRPVLTGSVTFDAADINERLESAYADRYFDFSVKNNLRRRIDPAEYQNDVSLRGEFIRTVMASDRTEEEKARILDMGLRALSGQEVDVR